MTKRVREERKTVRKVLKRDMKKGQVPWPLISFSEKEPEKSYAQYYAVHRVGNTASARLFKRGEEGAA